MKITKRQLRKIIKEEKQKLLSEQPGPGLQTYRVTMLVAIPPGSKEYILSSIEDGMDFDPTTGEGILEYDIRQEGKQGLAGETYEKTAADYKKHPEWFN